MTLDPDKTLAPTTVEAMRLAAPERPKAEVDDPALLRLALGAADAETRLRCAQAILTSPTTRARLLNLRKDHDFILRDVEKARQIDRILAEGRWTDGSALLERELPDLRAAWTRADALGMHDAVETFVFALLSPFMESGNVDDFASLVAVGHRAAEATGNVKLESRCLAYEGVVAAVKGDHERAKERWTRRLELNRRAGRLAPEADALIDLAGQAVDEGDFETARARLAEAVPVVAASGNAELAATLEAMFARESLRVGDLAAAKLHAERALATQTGAQGLDVNLFIRVSAAKIFTRCGEARLGIELFADTLTQCVEGGKPRQAAHALAALSDVLGAEGRIALAARCLAVAATIHRQVGTRHIEASRKRLDTLLGENPDLPRRASKRLGPPPSSPSSKKFREKGKMAGAIR